MIKSCVYVYICIHTYHNPTFYIYVYIYIYTPYYLLYLRWAFFDHQAPEASHHTQLDSEISSLCNDLTGLPHWESWLYGLC